MKKISELIAGKTIERNSSAPRSQHAEQIEELMRFMGEPEKGTSTYAGRYRYWCGRTKKLSLSALYAMRRKAEEGTNPRALFNYLLKESNKK